MTNFLFFCLLLLSALPFISAVRSITSQHSDIFDVTDYGAAGDGLTDDTQAFRDAWEATCKYRDSPTFYVPSGKTFLLQPVEFSGQNCQAGDITVEIDGSLIAPSDPSAWACHENKCEAWIAFVHLDGLDIRGSGTINGQGASWWNLSCNHKHDCRRKPTGFVIGHSNNVYLSQLTFENSPQMHIALESSTWVYISDLTIRAPGHSPNTDGIHIQGSTGVFIDQTSIGTGDDCISIGDGSAYLNISNILCGPGHGISIGSLGKDGEYETVEFVHVRNVIFTGTSNGVRIKTWQGGRGYARNIVFERIISHGSTLPIVIDQYYCDHTHCRNHTSAVHVSNVTYKQIRGTSHRKTAVKLACSERVPCTDISMNDVNIQSTDKGHGTSAYCLNVEGTQIGEAIPNVPCLN